MTKRSTGEGNGKPLQYSCLETPVNCVKRQRAAERNTPVSKETGASVLKLWWGWVSVAGHSRYYTEQNLDHFTISKNVNTREGVEQMDPFYTVGGNVNWYSHKENSMEVL